jgi:predicted DNA-binding antitoxin AbrB/MazE fold protein
MLKTVEVIFDGKVFVPTEPIDLPTGTKLTLAVPEAPVGNNSPPIANQPRAMTDEEKQKWEQLCRHWKTTPPSEQEKAAAERILRGDGTPLPWATVEEALGRPRYQS